MFSLKRTVPVTVLFAVCIFRERAGHSEHKKNMRKYKADGTISVHMYYAAP